MNMDLHNYKRQMDRQIELSQESKEICKENKTIILEFKDYLLSEGIGVAKIGRYILDIRKFNGILKKPFKEAQELDIRRVVAEIEQGILAPESKKCFKVMLRKLYRFIRGISEKRVYPPEVRWFSINIPQNHRKLPEELLTEEEIQNIIQACRTSRDRALFATLAESGCRVSEIGLMKIKNIAFEPYGTRLTVNGKTGMRKILVVSSTPYLQDWLNQHPCNSNPEAYLWHNTQKREVLTYSRIAAILKDAAKVAGIKKRVYPHLLRHSRATALAGVLSDAQMKNYLGWTQSSKMAGIYVHLSGKDTDEAILRVNNISVKQEVRTQILQPKNCHRCNSANPATHKFCNKCGFVLDAQTAIEIIKQETEQKSANDMLNKLLQDPEIKGLLMSKIKGVESI